MYQGKEEGQPCVLQGKMAHLLVREARFEQREQGGVWSRVLRHGLCNGFPSRSNCFEMAGNSMHTNAVGAVLMYAICEIQVSQLMKEIISGKINCRSSLRMRLSTNLDISCSSDEEEA